MNILPQGCESDIIREGMVITKGIVEKVSGQRQVVENCSQIQQTGNNSRGAGRSWQLNTEFYLHLAVSWSLSRNPPRRCNWNSVWQSSSECLHKPLVGMQSKQEEEEEENKTKEKRKHQNREEKPLSSCSQLDENLTLWKSSFPK